MNANKIPILQFLADLRQLFIVNVKGSNSKTRIQEFQNNLLADSICAAGNHSKSFHNLHSFIHFLNSI